MKKKFEVHVIHTVEAGSKGEAKRLAIQKDLLRGGLIIEIEVIKNET